MTDPFVRLDATAQAALARRGEVTAGELVEAAIRRIEAVNGPLNAVVHKLYDQARARAAGPLGDGPFAGVPFLIKDLLPLAGAPNTSSCRALKDVVGQVSPPYTRAFDACGLITVGLTNTPEFGLIDTTEPLLNGATHNPWDLERSPAGSSGGSGAAVAAGMTPMAHGNDGGGSIRLPACHNGVFGLKPSRGRGLTTGFPTPPFGLPPLGVDHVLTRSVRDSARMLSVTEDPRTPLGAVGFVDGASGRPLRIALLRAGADGRPASPEVDEATLATARLCESLGHAVTEADWPFSGEALTAAFLDEWMLMATGAVTLACAMTGRPADTDHFEPWTLGLAEGGKAVTAERASRAVGCFAQATAGLEAMFGRYDVLLSPVLRHPPKPLGRHAPDLDFDVLWERVTDNVAYTPVFNVSGMPAMSVPLQWSTGGLPIGSQFAAPLGGESILLQLAYQLEAAQPWAGRWAPNSAVAVEF